jgi:formylglycine-generating enzyme required for sulfatase activity
MKRPILCLLLCLSLTAFAGNPGKALPRGTTKVNPKDGLTYVWIPPGTFQMGCSLGDGNCFEDESPAHTVTITRSFWIGQTEVTQTAYQLVIGRNPSHFRGRRLPVESVTWDEANTYCGAVGMRLPTEAEWEYAARAGSTAPRYGEVSAIAWSSVNSGGKEGKTHEVAQKEPNLWKLYDMLGNVGEWVADWYDERYYGQAPSQNPQGPSAGQRRVVRGGSCYIYAEYIRASTRTVGLPSGGSGVGFRCGGQIP